MNSEVESSLAGYERNFDVHGVTQIHLQITWKGIVQNTSERLSAVSPTPLM
jgi:hypothetical protein